MVRRNDSGVWFGVWFRGIMDQWIRLFYRMKYGMYPLVNIQKAIEHGPFIVNLPLKMMIFHSYVSLP